jgi:hypothetical protein
MAPPGVLEINATDMIAGARMEIHVSGANPGDSVLMGIGWSDDGSLCPAMLGGLCITITRPLMMRPLTADAEGSVVFSGTVPIRMLGKARCLQATVADGADSKVSDAWCATVELDSDGDGVGDSRDVCEGFDDATDTDGDGVPDGCDEPDVVLPFDGQSCAEILLYDAEAPSGNYTLDPDLDGPMEPFLGYCEMDHHGGGWTLVLSAGIDAPQITNISVGPHGEVSNSDDPGVGGFNKLSDDAVNALRLNAPVRSDGTEIAYWTVTPGDGLGLIGAENFHRGDCTFKMGQNQAGVQGTDGGVCAQNIWEYTESPSWRGGGMWWPAPNDYRFAFGHWQRGDHAFGGPCYLDGRGLGASSFSGAFHRGWCAADGVSPFTEPSGSGHKAWGQVWVR